MRLKSRDKVFDIANSTIMFIFVVLCLYPLWYCVIQSFSNLNLVSARDVWIVPVDFTISNYKAVFEDSMLINSFFVSVKRTLIGSVVSVMCCAMAAYALSKSYLIFRKFFTVFLLITMYFGGGLVPYFILMKGLGLTNNFWGYILPSIYGGFTIIIMRTFFKSIPAEIEESAKIDGASDLSIFFQFVLPLSKALLATMLLFSAVGHWNDWFQGDLLMHDEKLLPLSTILMRVITRNNMIARSAAGQTGEVLSSVMRPSPVGIKMATVIVATMPILLVYPYLQKYFAKGVMIGSVKG